MRSHPKAIKYDGARSKAKTDPFHNFLAGELVRSTNQATTRATATATIEAMIPRINEWIIETRKREEKTGLKEEKVNHCGP